MPSYHSAGISVSLGTLPLSECITPKVAIRKGDVAARQYETAENKLRESEFLAEERVQFPGDEENFAVNWVAGAPFLQVLARRDASQVNRKYPAPGRTIQPKSVRGTLKDCTESAQDAASNGDKSCRRATRAHPQSAPVTIDPAPFQITPSSNHSTLDDELTPKALVLHVMLTKKTFFKSILDDSAQHLKIDVFFNGLLSGCVLVHQGDIRTGAKSMHQIFAGTRVDYLVERPWVILPPEQDVDGTLRESRRATGVQERWHQICQALTRAANDRGVDEHGGRPPSSEYLRTLASMSMPDAVHDLQKPGGRKFGVVDVVVTVGIGNKITSGTSYLSKPMSLVDQRFLHGPALSSTQVYGNRKEPDVTRQSKEHVHKSNDHNIRAGTMHVDGRNCHLKDRDDENHSELASPATTPSAQPYLNTSPHFAFIDPFNGTQIATNPQTQVTSYPDSPSSYSILQALQQRKRDFSEFAASADVQGTGFNGHFRSQGRQQSPSSAHAPAPPAGNFHQPVTFTSEFNLNQYDGFMHANPYQLPYADMMVGLDHLDSAGRSNVSTFDGPSSSPLRHDSAGQLTLPPFNPLSPAQTQDMEQTGTYLPLTSSPFPAPELLPSQARRSSLGPTSISTCQPGGLPMEAPPRASISDSRLFVQPASVYSNSPLLQRNMTLGLPPHLQMNSIINPDCSPMGPLPPIGLFSATKRARSSPPKDPGVIDPDQPRSSTLVRRLRITGIGGNIIVDHIWKSPQRIATRLGLTGLHHLSSKSRSPAKSRLKLSDASEHVDTTTANRRKSTSVAAMATPPPTSPDEMFGSNTRTIADKGKRDSVHNTRSVHESKVDHPDNPVLATKPSAPTRITEQNVNTRGDNPSTSDNNTSCMATKLSAPTRHRTTFNGILGVQGVKATKFIFDNPEELLRKMIKSRSKSRSLSPTKVDVALAANGADQVRGAKARAMEKVLRNAGVETGSSSPLSSLPTSPEMQAESDKSGGGKATVLSLPVAATSAPAASSQGPQSTNDISAPQTALATLKSGTSVRAIKKKKTTYTLRHQHTSPRKREPRSPSRLSATGNPELNRGSVLQFAVSEAEGGALRQVKSERQGVFTEESVVVGMRFFIAG